MIGGEGMRRFAWLGIVMAVAGCGVLGDDPGDGPIRYVAIGDAPETPAAVPATADGSTGSWREDCGRNERGIRNSDNLVVNPGVVGAAHHLHDYVGNVSTNAFSTDKTLAAAATTCRGGDRSSYYWPVLRVPGSDHSAGAGEHDAHGNEGQVVPPASVTIEFRGNPVSDVVSMPEFLRTATGNAHGFSQGGKHTDHLQWTCSGARDHVAKDYPRCSDGQQVIRIFDFPSCWNGKSLDSPDHSSHLVFPTGSGACPPATFPVPQLHVEVAYTVPKDADFTVDTFPEDGRSALADHSHFINVMQPALMGRLVACLNEGRRCTA
jgi:hypothetical protein